MEDETKQLQLEQNPTPSGESREFENPDDRRRREDKEHEITILNLNQGKIGKLTGSAETNINFAFFAVSIAGFCAVGSLIGMIWQPAVFGESLKFFGTVILTVAGYVFGVKSK